MFEPPNSIDNSMNYLCKAEEHHEIAQKLVKQHKEKFFKTHEKHLKRKGIPQFDLGDTVYMKDLHYVRLFEPKYLGPFSNQRKNSTSQFELIKFNLNIKYFIYPTTVYFFFKPMK